jgi:4-hydroxythreonine-4-phosphate dehydrogenase
MGDPSGIAPQITIKALKQLSGINVILMADFDQMDGLARESGLDIERITHPRDLQDGQIGIIHTPLHSKPIPGTPDPGNAPSIIASIEKAVALAKNGDVDAIVTNPISKKILIDGADFAHPGHTEFLAELDGKSQVVMMLASEMLRAVPATVHIPLSDVPTALTREDLRKTIEITHQALRNDFGIANPRIAIAGLNPHAGENGIMGHEEIDLIAPVLDDLRHKGMTLLGPLSADTMFHAAARKTYDAAICMYHDQALIPLKTLDFAGGVNVTLGLSFIRTSPDHGTAFDIADQDVADPTSLINAIKMAADMAHRRHG